MVLHVVINNISYLYKKINQILILISFLFNNLYIYIYMYFFFIYI